MFTVIIPVYNRADKIGPTLSSVMAQSFRDFECIVVDDGSTDSERLKSEVASLDDARFLYLHRPNGGGGAARNTGIDNARGRYIAFLDSDDFFLPEKLEFVAKCISADDQRVLYSQNFISRSEGGNTWIRPERGIGRRETVATYLFIENQFIQTSTIVLSSSLARKVKFDPTLRKGQDLDFCIRLEQAGASFEMLPKPLSIWNDHSEGNRTSRTRGYEQPEAWLASHVHLMTPDEVAGYKATSLAYYWGWSKPVRAFCAILAGLPAGVALPVVMRQMARTFFPRQLYRQIVDLVVASAGRREGAIAKQVER